jgi:predicted dehydrogenase
MKTEMNRRNFLKTATIAAGTVVIPQITKSAEEGTITLAFVGCAHIHTPGFINLLKSRKDVKVKYVWDHDAKRAERRAKDLGCPAVDDAAKIWSDPEVVGVVICSETQLHSKLVADAAKAKKHMFVEKPLGVNGAESREMASAIQKAGVLFTTGYFMRTDPKHIFLKDQIAKGAFGKITRIRGSNCHSGSLGGWFDTEWRWMADPRIAGVGAFGDLGTHSLDIMMWLLGDVESVIADIRVVTGRYADCDETGEAMMKFKNGAIGTLAAGWVDVDNPVTLLISGTEGHAVIVNNELYFKSSKVQGADGRKPWRDLPQAPPLPMHQFVNAIAGQKDMPLVKPDEAAARVYVMDAAYKSVKTGAWEKVA